MKNKQLKALLLPWRNNERIIGVTAPSQITTVSTYMIVLQFPAILVSCRKHNVLTERNNCGGRYNVISGLCNKWLLPIGYINKRSRDKSFFFLLN